MIPNPAKCPVCAEQTHTGNMCPTLYEPTKEGFYKPSGGGGGHSHGDDDDDEKIDIKRKPNLKCNYEKVKA